MSNRRNAIRILISLVVALQMTLMCTNNTTNKEAVALRTSLYRPRKETVNFVSTLMHLESTNTNFSTFTSHIPIVNKRTYHTNEQSELKRKRNRKTDEHVCTCTSDHTKRETDEFSDIFKTFWPYTKIVRYLYYVAEAYPKRVRLIELGKTYEGRVVYSINIGLGLEGNNVVFIDAGMRARDWSSVMLALYIIHILLECNRYEQIGFIDWVIMPLVNPDGYDYSFKKPSFRMWNKNRSPCKIQKFTICKGLEGCGVDIHKNFPYMFPSGIGTSKDECSNFYGGSSPSSENETNMTIEHLEYFKNQIKLYIGLHSYGALLLHPFASKNEKTDNYNELVDLAKLAVKVMNRRIFSKSDHYSHGTYIHKIVPVSGTPLDYIKGTLKVPYTYFLHLRGVYQISSSDILPIITESFFGICTMVREIYYKYPASKKFLRKFKGFRRRRRNLSNISQPFNYYTLILVSMYLS